MLSPRMIVTLNGLVVYGSPLMLRTLPLCHVVGIELSRLVGVTIVGSCVTIMVSL